MTDNIMNSCKQNKVYSGKQGLKKKHEDVKIWV